MSADSAESQAGLGSHLLFTAPWDTVFVRKGDALGLRALADQFADAVAPDFSNRIRDGRWVTILAWCLARSQEVFHASGGLALDTRAEQGARYTWLRPLELMWVARTMALAEADWGARSLAGRRSVGPWREGGQKSDDHFGMSMDQFLAYRQTGMYGGYRLAFRRWPHMTLGGDGWTPGTATNDLAKWLDKRLGSARPSWRLHSGGGDEESLSTRSAKLGRGGEHEWWLKKWQNYDHGGRRIDETLPRRKDEFKTLPESPLLRPIIFGNDQSGQRRLKVARAAAKHAGAEHIDICDHLAHVFGGDPAVRLLPRFSRLADAGMEVMDLMARALRKNSGPTLADATALPGAVTVCRALMREAKDWRDHKAKMPHLPHLQTAHGFASAIPSSGPMECMRAVLHHHEFHGGGLRWFVLRNSRIELRTPSGGSSSRYRFRLWSLCRLATQCGVAPNMPPALLSDSAEDTDE